MGNAFRMKYDTVEQFGEGLGPADHTPSQCDMHQPKVMLWPATRPAHFEVGMTLSVLRPVWPHVAGIDRFDAVYRLCDPECQEELVQPCSTGTRAPEPKGVVHIHTQNFQRPYQDEGQRHMKSTDKRGILLHSISLSYENEKCK